MAALQRGGFETETSGTQLALAAAILNQDWLEPVTTPTASARNAAHQRRAPDYARGESNLIGEPYQNRTEPLAILVQVPRPTRFDGMQAALVDRDPDENHGYYTVLRGELKGGLDDAGRNQGGPRSQIRKVLHSAGTSTHIRLDSFGFEVVTHRCEVSLRIRSFLWRTVLPALAHPAIYIWLKCCHRCARKQDRHPFEIQLS